MSRHQFCSYVFRDTRPTNNQGDVDIFLKAAFFTRLKTVLANMVTVVWA